MVKTIKRIELIEFLEALRKLDGEEKNDRIFTYAVARNYSKLEAEGNAIMKANTIPDKYYEFEAKRQSILREYAKLDDNGEIIINDNGTLNFEDEDLPKVREELSKLEEEYKDDLEETIKERQEFDEFLLEEIEVDVVEVDIEKFPEKLSLTDIQPLMVMVKE